MAATASIKFEFQSPYRGGTKNWSTTNHVTGGDWQDQTHFNALSDAVWTEWRTAMYPHVTLLSSVGYNGGSALPVFSKSYNQAGTATLGSLWYTTLEACILLKYTTDQRSAKNHPIYLFNYLHGFVHDAATTPDELPSGTVSNWNTRIADWVAGFSDGTLTRHRAGPNGAVAQGGSVNAYFSHRDFPH